MAANVAGKLQHPLKASDALSLDAALMQARNPHAHSPSPPPNGPDPIDDLAEKAVMTHIVQLQNEQKQALAEYAEKMATGMPRIFAHM